MTNASTIGRSAGRKLGLWSAEIAAVLALATCGGCDQQVRQDVRQGAYDVFSAGLSSVYSELSSGITTGISDLADKSSAADAARTP